VLLPAASEAYALKDKNLLQEYVVDCLRYSILTVLPLCVLISIFSLPIMIILFGSTYAPSSGVLSILVIGMSFYTIYMICSSILQGINSPRIPMYILLVGTVINLINNFYFVDHYGILGAGIGTTITTAILMCVILMIVVRKTDIRIPWNNILRIIIANIILAAICIFIPKSILGCIIGFIIGIIVYLISILELRIMTKRDLNFFMSFLNKIPFMNKYDEKIVKYIEKKNLIYKLE
jgi:stage V sporulation protein B